MLLMLKTILSENDLKKCILNKKLNENLKYKMQNNIFCILNVDFVLIYLKLF